MPLYAERGIPAREVNMSQILQIVARFVRNIQRSSPGSIFPILGLDVRIVISQHTHVTFRGNAASRHISPVMTKSLTQV